MSQVIDSLTQPMSYDTASRSFAFYSEDFDLIGSQEFTIQAFLIDHPTIVTTVEMAFIDISNPCPDPDLVLATPQMTLLPYKYTGASSKAQFTLNPFTVVPSTCPVLYSCEIVTGPRLDICTVNDGTT